MLVSLSIQGAGLKSDISSLSSNVLMNHMDVHSSISSQHTNSLCSLDCNSNTPLSEQNSPDMHYATMPCQISVLKNNNFDSRYQSTLNSLKEEEKVKD